MCDPVSVAVVGSSLINAYGSYQAGQEGKALGELRAKMNEQAANDAIMRGEHEAAMHRIRVSSLVGKQRTAFAASGIDVDSGTAVDVQVATGMMGEYDIQKIKNNAAREAWGYRVKAIESRMEGDAAEKAGTYGMFGSILGGGGQLFGMKGMGSKTATAG